MTADIDTIKFLKNFSQKSFKYTLFLSSGLVFRSSIIATNTLKLIKIIHSWSYIFISFNLEAFESMFIGL